MGQRKYPPLTPKQIESILLARGYEYVKSKGDHNFYERTVNGKKHVAQIDMGANAYNANWIKMLLTQSGMTRKQFYCSTKTAAKKLGMKKETKEQLENWAT